MLRYITVNIVILFLAIASANGQNIDYVRLAPGGSFRNPSLWTPFNPVPPPPIFLGPGGASDRAHFNLGQSFLDLYTISAVNGLNDQLIVHNDSVELQITDYETGSGGIADDASIVVGASPGDVGIVVFSGDSSSELRSVHSFLGESNGATGSAIVNGSGFNWINSETIWVGTNGNGNLIVLDGSVSSLNGAIAFGPNTTCAAEVSGPDSQWTNQAILLVGAAGDGTLEVEDGGFVSCNGASIGTGATAVGTVTVDGTGSFLEIDADLSIAESGNGTMQIQNGGMVDNHNADIGEEPGADGLAIVDGPESCWINHGLLNIGDSGIGELEVRNGGLLVCLTFGSTIARNEGSRGNVTIDGPGSLWDAAIVTVGLFGDGLLDAFLDIVNGGSCSCRDGYIGQFDGAGGCVTVDGANSIWQMDEDFILGDSGGALLDIQNGGEVSCSDAFLARTSGGATVVVSGAGSQLTVTNDLSVGGNANTNTNGGFGSLTIESSASLDVGDETVLFPGGTIDLEGGTLSSDLIRFEGGGNFNWTGGTLHVVFYNGDLLNQGGTLAPGQSAGSTTIFGDYDQDDQATLGIEIGGPGVGSEHDFVSINGDAFIDGQMRLVLIDSFIPTPEQEFTVANVSGTIFGFFGNAGDNQRVDTVGGEGSFLVRYGLTSPNPNQIILSDFEPSFILGDVNGDGEVNLLDVGPFIDLLTNGEFNPAADINMDGEVDLLDVALFVALLAG